MKSPAMKEIPALSEWYLSLDNAGDDESVREFIVMTNRQRIQKVHPNRIWQRDKDGKWCTHIYIEGKRRQLIYSKKDDLLDKLIAIYKDAEYDPTLRELFDDWIAEKESFNEVTGATLDRYRVEFVRHFERTGFADRAIKEISRADLEDFVRGRVATGLTKGAYRNLKIVLTGIFRYASRNGVTTLSIRDILDEMPLGKKSFEVRPKTPESEVFSEGETKKLMRYLREHPDTLNRALLLDFLTGLRSGELCALKKEDFVDDRYLHICRTETKIKGSSETGSTTVKDMPKTENGDRLVYLTDEARDLVIELIHDPNAADSEWLLIGAHNHRRVIRTTFRRRLENVCDACGVKRKSLHKIRKTYASQLLASGVEEQIVCAQLGHADISTTRKYYYYLRSEKDKRASQLESATAKY